MLGEPGGETWTDHLALALTAVSTVAIAVVAITAVVKYHHDARAERRGRLGEGLPRRPRYRRQTMRTSASVSVFFPKG